MADYAKYGSVVINGKKKIVYRKKGSIKNYCKCKGKMMGLSKYKKFVSKKIAKKTMKKKSGGTTSGPYNQSLSNIDDNMYMLTSQTKGAFAISGKSATGGSKKPIPKHCCYKNYKICPWNKKCAYNLKPCQPYCKILPPKSCWYIKKCPYCPHKCVMAIKRCLRL